jgi:hypothetical protein
MTAAILSAIVSSRVVVVTSAAVTTAATVVAGATVVVGAGTEANGDEASVVLEIDEVGASAGAAFEPEPPQDASTIRRSAPGRMIRMRQR